MSKKIISLVLAVVMALGVFSICAFAEAPTAVWTLEVTNTDGTPITGSIPTGTEVKVTVKLQSDFYIGTVGLPVFYSNAFSYVENSAVLTEIYGAGATRTGTSVDSIDAPSGYGVFYAVYVPNSSVAGVASPMYNTATTILTFNLVANTEATAEIKLDAAAQKTTANIGGKFYCGSRESADVTTDEAITGQTFTVPAAVPVVIANAAADPVLTGVNTGVVDTDNGYVYGVPAGQNVEDFFTVENGTFTVSGNGTGDTLTVYTTGGDEFAVYTVVIFGDVNGDGTVSAADTGAIKRALMGEGLTGAQAVAADANGSGSPAAPEVTAADTGAIKRALMDEGYTVANPYA